MKCLYSGIPIFFCLALFAGCGRERKAAHEAPARFVLPAIPAALAGPQARAGYLAAHYWDNFDFADTALVADDDVTEQAFADYAQALGIAAPQDARAAIADMLSRAMDADSSSMARMAALAEKYLYDPNSPARNEELYIPFLEFIVASDKVDGINKTRPRYQLEIALRNRPGEAAADFTYTMADGSQGRLRQIRSLFTLLFFNNPDCRDCVRVKEFIAATPSIGLNPDVKVLAVYPDGDLAAWQKTAYPAGWINSYDSKGMLKAANVYDLKAIPCLYLLDADKRVILKDAPVETIAAYLGGGRVPGVVD